VRECRALEGLQVTFILLAELQPAGLEPPPPVCAPPQGRGDTKPLLYSYPVAKTPCGCCLQVPPVTFPQAQQS
jgi:hypothetical protein